MRIKSTISTQVTTATTTPVAEMPTHVTGDLLVVFHAVDGGTTINVPAGWTSVASIVNSTNNAVRCMYLIAASGTETYTGSLGASVASAICVVCIDGFDVATPCVSVATRTTNDNSIPWDGATGGSTGTNNQLLFNVLAADGPRPCVAAPGWVNISNGNAVGCALGVSYAVKKTAGAVTPAVWYAQAADDSVAMLIAVNDDGALTRLPPYLQLDVSPGTLIESGYFGALGSANAWGNTFPSATLSLANIGSKTTAFDAPATSSGTGTNTQWESVNCTPAADTSGASVGGPEVNFGSAKDMTGKFLVYSWLLGIPSDYNDLSTPTDSGSAGMLLVARDAATYKAWSIGAQGVASTKADARNYAVIQVDQSTDSTWASSGSLDPAAVDGCLMLAQGRYGAVQWRWSGLHLVNEFAIAGGTSANPIMFADVVTVINQGFGLFPTALQEGEAVTLLAPIRFGGTDPLYYRPTSPKTFQYRQAADVVGTLDWHVDDGAAGFTFDDTAGGDMDFSGHTFVSASPTYFTFVASFDTDHISLLGATVVNQIVTLRSTMSLPRMSWISCGTFTQNNAELTGHSFTNTTVTSDNLADLIGCSFTSGGTGHAILATTTGTYTFTGNSFTGYGADGSTDAAIYNNSGGLITLNLSAGDATPTVRNGAGASTVINAATLTASITGIASGSRVYIYNVTSATAIYNGVPGTSYSAGYTEGGDYTTGDLVSIYVTQISGVTAKLSYQTAVIAGATGWSALVVQESDTVYDSNGIDGSTITIFTADYASQDIDLTTAANFTAAQWYAWWCYTLTTSQGITDFFGAVLAESAASYRIITAVVPLLFDTDQTSNHWQTDTARIYRDDGVRPTRNPTTGGGDVEINWRNQVFLEATGSGLTAPQAAQLAAASLCATNAQVVTAVAEAATPAEVAAAVADLPTAAEIITALEATAIPVDAVKMNGADILGNGTVSDKWRGE